MVFETWLKTDLKKPVVVQKLSGNLFSADNEGNLIGVEVFDNGEAATLSGNVNGYVIRPDGETVLVDGTLSGNKASIVLPSSAYAVVGQESIVIKVGGVTVGACVAYVYKSTTDVIVDPSHVVPSLAELLAKIADCEAATADANAAASLANEKATLADQKATLADQKATAANNAASSATSAASTANAAATKINDMTVAANGLNPGSSPTATISEVSGHKHIVFGIPKGDPGKDFHIAKTFTSISAMMAYTGTDVEAFDFAMIDTGSVEDPDTGKLYCYEPDKTPKWQYIGDLSGAQGIRGETGTGIDHITLNADYTLTIYLDDNTSYTTGSIRGATGETPDITIGTVTTLNFDQQAYVTLDPSSTPEDPVFNFGIPQGEPGSAENVYGNTIPMSSTDSTKVATAIGNKLDANQGSANAGKFMRVGSTGAVAYDSPTERYSSLNNFPATGDEGKIYIAEDTGMMYVWDSEYVPVGGTSSDECEVSGDIVSFETFESKAKKLVVDIDPVQDLHGYDNPWPGGGGKNIIGWKIDSANIETSGVISTGQSFDVYYAKVEANKTYTASGNTDLQDGGVIAFYTSVPESLSTSYNGSRTVLSNTKTFTSPIDGYVALRANQSDTNIQLEPGSTATDFAPYENLCPISGWTSADVTRTGKNLFGFASGDTKTSKDVTYVANDDGSVSCVSAGTGSGTSFGLETQTKKLKAGTYTVSVSGATDIKTRIVNASASPVEVMETITGSGSYTFTLTNETIIYYYLLCTASTSFNEKVYIQIERGSVATSFEQYKCNEYQIAFPAESGTVYGGTLTIRQDGTGTLLVENGAVDLGTLTWEYTSNNRFTAKNIPNMKISALRTIDLMCSCYKTNVGGGAYDDKTIYNGAVQDLYIVDTNYSEVAPFTASVTGQTAVYPLETKVSYELTAQQVVSLLKGVNNVWADCGSIDLTYYRTETACQVSLNTADIAELQQDTNGKADKDTEAVEGNFAEFDDSGNPVDSGHKHSDYLTGKRLAAQTLSAGSTTLTFSDAAITTSSTIVPYASVWGISPTAVTVTTGQVVLTFDAMQEAISAYIEVWG